MPQSERPFHTVYLSTRGIPPHTLINLPSGPIKPGSHGSARDIQVPEVTLQCLCVWGGGVGSNVFMGVCVCM